MLNWPVHGKDYYLNVISDLPEVRAKEYTAAINQTLGFIYFLQTTLGMKNMGLADDELNNGLALIPYNREGRRVKGVVRLTINHLKNLYQSTLYRTGIAVGNYPVDHHHAQYPGKVPTIKFPPIPSFTIPLGCLIPEKVENLIVCEKGISVSNIVNGASRLQPVVLLTGQAAGVLAAQCIKRKNSPRDVEVRRVQEELLNHQCYLMPFADISPDDPHWKAIQRIGVTGLLKGVGKPEGWENKMFFYPDSLIKVSDVIAALKKIKRYKESLIKDKNLLYAKKEEYMKMEDVEFILWALRKNLFDVPTTYEPAWRKELQLFIEREFNKDFNPGALITRKEVAVIMDYFLQPFAEPVSLNGN